MENGYFSCDGLGGTDQPSSRRQLIAAGLGAGLLLFGRRTALAQTTFRKKPKDGPVMVVIFLRGGADALNVVAPYGEDAYYRSRPTLALGRPTDRTSGANERLLDLDGFFGLHPALSDLYPLFADGRAAIVHAVGSGDETRSHFEAMGTMERGLYAGTERTANGWLARHLALDLSKSSPLRALAVGATLPDSLSGAAGTVVCESLSEYRLRTTPGSEARLHNALSNMYQGDDEIAESGRRTLGALQALRERNPSEYNAEHGATYADNPLAQALKQVAYLVKSDLGLEIACLEALGWDTHIAQGGATGWQANLLKDLGGSLAAFFKDLGAESDRVCVVVQSEFGRRLEENSGFGTDHGHGGFMLAVGGKVKGGKVYGKWPGLAKENLVGPGDLAVTTDYRSVLAEVLDKHLSCPNTSRVFPGWSPTSVGLF